MWIPFKGLLAGAAGAIALTALHEVTRRSTPKAPRLDVLGMRSVARLMGREPDDLSGELHKLALGADLGANSMYYSLAGTFGSAAAPTTGAFLGLAAGVGSVALPEKMGLGAAPTRHSPETQALTVAMYVIGGLVAGLVYKALSDH